VRMKSKTDESIGAFLSFSLLLRPINRTLEGWDSLPLLYFHFAFLRFKRVSHEQVFDFL
jgi:hypothetical protein